jgi:hypothetical protein
LSVGYRLDRRQLRHIHNLPPHLLIDMWFDLLIDGLDQGFVFVLAIWRPIGRQEAAHTATRPIATARVWIRLEGLDFLLQNCLVLALHSSLSPKTCRASEHVLNDGVIACLLGKLPRRALG